MAFVAVEDNTRLVDPERGLELLRDDAPTGSSGYLSFRLVGPDTDAQFYAKTTNMASLRGIDDPADRHHVVWRIFATANLEHPGDRRLWLLIREAMIAFRSWFGLGRPEWSYSVVQDDGAGR